VRSVLWEPAGQKHDDRAPVWPTGCDDLFHISLTASAAYVLFPSTGANARRVGTTGNSQPVNSEKSREVGLHLLHWDSSTPAMEHAVACDTLRKL